MNTLFAYPEDLINETFNPTFAENTMQPTLSTDQEQNAENQAQPSPQINLIIHTTASDSSNESIPKSPQHSTFSDERTVTQTLNN